MAKPSAIELIKRARTILDNGWTKGDYAQSENGKSVPLDSEAASKFCAIGGLRRAYLELTGEVASSESSIRYAADVFFPEASDSTMNLIDFNDMRKTTKDAVVSLFDQAIEKLEAVHG